MGCVARRMALRVFRPHVALGNRQVAQSIAQREFFRGVRPINLVARNAPSDTHGALAHTPKIMQERLNTDNFHDHLRKHLFCLDVTSWIPSPAPAAAGIAAAGLSSQTMWRRHKVTQAARNPQ